MGHKQVMEKNLMSVNGSEVKSYAYISEYLYNYKISIKQKFSKRYSEIKLTKELMQLRMSLLVMWCKSFRLDEFLKQFWKKDNQTA